MKLSVPLLRLRKILDWFRGGELRTRPQGQSPTNSSEERHAPQRFTSGNLAISLFEFFQEYRISEWPLSNMLEAYRNEPEEYDINRDAAVSLFDADKIPYHDQAATIQYFCDLNERLTESPECLGIMQELANSLGAMSSNPTYADHLNQEGVRLASGAINAYQVGGKNIITGMRNAIKIARDEIPAVQAGKRLPLLYQFDLIMLSTCTSPGENGYTEVFRGGQEYSLSYLRDSLMTRNTTLQSEAHRNVVTVAISYKHYWEGDGRICRTDLEAIAYFIRASHESHVRFWIDARLPSNSDRSFERWLRRGLQPYARYMTLICPSAAASTDRFWLANERDVALAGKGIFYFEGDGIYFRKRGVDMQTLSKRMLKIMVGVEGLPPGVRPEDEGKASQWALSVLGSEHNFQYSFSQPKLGELVLADYDENYAMSRIAKIVKTESQIILPLEAGQTWNKQNPLVKGRIGNQRLRIASWLGLADGVQTRNIYLVHLTQLPCLRSEETCVVLCVKLAASFDAGHGNYIQEKILREIASIELRYIRAVMVPETCTWPVFSGTQ